MRLSTVAAALLASVIALGAQQQAEAKGCLSGAALGGVAGHYVHHTFFGMFAGCIGGRQVYKMYARWKENHPDGTMHQFVEDHRDNLPPGWANKLETLAPQNVPAH